ncbi:hypothetical protein P3T36_004555 [Kitasatospora sp. MAP12-15]|uniref:helix-turn-helix transcriptional regulator n=1 Tax=unclassified Kitasatospora TaxID=2633591 RepID=UPI002473ABD3|nr:helix-turn-helix transcriptional regulator [Kitasatospora sp. MAP12-44]MDH6111401.1 hypothetical protein [Kitasatospora sp. MAP12-44]
MRTDHQGAASHRAASFPEHPVWIPAHIIRLYCGRDFDVLRIDADAAQRVLDVIGPDCGPVITSAFGYWDFLLPLGEFVRESVPRAPGVRAMPPGTQIDVPPLTATPAGGLYWQVPPGAGSTNLRALAAALVPPPAVGTRLVGGRRAPQQAPFERRPRPTFTRPRPEVVPPGAVLVGVVVRHLREQRRLSPAMLARAAAVPLTALNGVESGARLATAPLVTALLTALGLDVHDRLGSASALVHLTGTATQPLFARQVADERTGWQERLAAVEAAAERTRHLVTALPLLPAPAATATAGRPARDSHRLLIDEGALRRHVPPGAADRTRAVLARAAERGVVRVVPLAAGVLVTPTAELHLPGGFPVLVAVRAGEGVVYRTGPEAEQSIAVLNAAEAAALSTTDSAALLLPPRMCAGTAVPAAGARP